MKANSRIKFNPVTREIEVEGSESFVKVYFAKLQSMLAGSPEKPALTENKSRSSKAVPQKKAKAGLAIKSKKSPVAAKSKQAKKVIKTPKKALAKKRVTNIDSIVMLIRENAEGISTAELKEKTGLSENQIWNIVNRAAKEGRIKKIKRGLYGAGENTAKADGPVIV